MSGCQEEGCSAGWMGELDRGQIMCDLVGNIKGSDFYSKSDGIDGGISSRGMTLSDLHSCKVAPASMGRMDWGGEWQQGKLLGRIAEVQATNAGDFE